MKFNECKWFGGNKGGLTVERSRADFALSIALCF